MQLFASFFFRVSFPAGPEYLGLFLLGVDPIRFVVCGTKVLALWVVHPFEAFRGCRGEELLEAYPPLLGVELGV
jgi:hypothetical protein